MSCCKLMSEALEYAHQRETRPPGLGMQQLMNINTGQPTRRLLLYSVPGYGKGKDRKAPQTFVVKNCPFCGKATGVEKHLEKPNA